MTIKAGLFALAVAAIPAGGCAPAPEDEARQILRTALRYEARFAPDAGHVCFVSGLAPPHLAETRRRRTDASDLALPGGLWHRPQPADGSEMPPLPEHEQQALFDLQQRIVRAPERQPSRRASIEPLMLPPPLRLCGPGEPPPSHQLVSAPDIAGDTAFIRMDLFCPGFCGGGTLFALRRERGEWRIIGATTLWAS
ncbi:MAG TPA: hypothetical protein VGB08_08445 [Allosphingosinicella sp.]|jgi:hypothetical protein